MNEGKLVFSGLQQRLLSSPEAFKKTLEVHLRAMKAPTDAERSTVGILATAFADGKEKLGADKHYTKIESEIRESAKKLPLTVSGDVAWVAAQTSPTHLRLTLIDGGYINPKSSTAMVHFHIANPAKMTDVLFGTQFDVSDPSSVPVSVPCGMFRFIDIELTHNIVQ